MGGRVELALFFDALSHWAEDRWDELDPAPPLSAERLLAAQAPILSEMIAPGRAAGRLHLSACSASCRFLGLDLARVQARVDALLGWQTFSQKIAAAARTVTF